MAYTKTQWVNNEEPSINATNLNKMEQGIADAQFPDGGSTGQILSKTNDGTGWVDAPTSAEWGNIEGQISEQTDLYSELESKITMPSGGTTGQVLTKTATGQAWQDASGGGNVDTVNGISPDANKNVQTATDLTEAAYEALPSTKESDNVDYYLTDADSTIATAEDIPYDNTTSGMTATNVQGAVDELNNGLTAEFFECTNPYNQYTSGQGVYLPQNKVVLINVRVGSTSNIAMDVPLLNVPEKYRPSTTVNGSAFMYTNSAPTAGELILLTNGNIVQESSNYLRHAVGVIMYAIDTQSA